MKVETGFVPAALRATVAGSSRVKRKNRIAVISKMIA